jgi:hypothetical protein
MGWNLSEPPGEGFVLKYIFAIKMKKWMYDIRISWAPLPLKSAPEETWRSLRDEMIK